MPAHTAESRETKARVETLDERAWRELVPHFRDLAYTQSFGYSQAMAGLHGARAEFVAVREGDQVLGLASIRHKPLALLGTGLAYLSRGPLTRRGERTDGDAVARCLAALGEELVERRNLVLRVQPPVGAPPHEDEVLARMAPLGLTPMPDERRYHTLLLDLAPDEETLKKELSKRWRRHLNQSLRSELEVRVSTSDDDFEAFCALYDEMIGRKRFDTDLDARFYADLQRGLPSDERFQIHLGLLDGEAVAGLVISSLGDTSVYVLGATGPRGREVQASYRLHWEVVLEAKRQGLAWYDLGGIDMEGNPGVTTFKQGIARIDVHAPGPFQRVPSTWSGRLVPAGEWLYRRTRGLRGRLRRGPDTTGSAS